MGEADVEKQERRPCEDEGRGWNHTTKLGDQTELTFSIFLFLASREASRYQEIPRIASSQQKLRERQGMDSLSEPP